MLITGAAGFLGGYVARQFSDSGWQVDGVDQNPPQAAPRRCLDSYHQRRLPDESLDGVIAETRPALLIHCAGRASVPLSFEDPVTDFRASSVATFETLDSLRRIAPECRFILLSSAAVYGDPARLPVSEQEPASPLSPYGFHKWQCEQLCAEFARVYGMRTISARLFSAYGEGLKRQALWDICSKAMQTGGLRLLGVGNETRDFLHASDIARGLEILAERADLNGGVYNLASGVQSEIGAIARWLLEELDIDVTPEFDGVVPRGYPGRWQADISKVLGLGFEPRISLREGVRGYAKWFQGEFRIS